MAKREGTNLDNVKNDAVETEARRVFIAAGSHHFTHELEGMLTDICAELGAHRVTVGRLPEPLDAADGLSEPAALERPVCAARRTADRSALAKRGWDPMTVCRDCRFGPERGKRPRCGYLRAVDEAWQARVVIGPRHHMSRGEAFWDGPRGRTVTRLVLEEDPVGELLVDHELRSGEAGSFADALEGLARGLALDADGCAATGDAVRRVPKADRTEEDRRELNRARAKGRRARRGADAALAAAHVLRALEEWRPGATGTAVRLDLGELDTSGLDRPRRDLAGLDAAMQAREEPRGRRNLLPLATTVGRAHARGAPLAGRRVEGSGGTVLAVAAPQTVPQRIGTLVLDATGDPELVGRVLGRAPVEALEARPTRRAAPHLVQVAGSLWSRSRLFEEGEHDRTEVGKLADLLAEVVRRVGARRVGLVSYMALVGGEETGPAGEPCWVPGPLTTALGARVAETDPDAELVGRHFGAMRGTNALGDVDCLLVAGTPLVPLSELQRRALVLGADVDEVQGEAAEACWRDDHLAPGVERRWGRWGDVLDRVERRVVAEELVQAIGRGARGDRPPPGGVWLFSSADIGELVADARWLGTPSELGLRVPPATWDALAPLLRAGTSEREAAARVGCPYWQARFVSSALPAWPVHSGVR